MDAAWDADRRACSRPTGGSGWRSWPCWSSLTWHRARASPARRVPPTALTLHRPVHQRVVSDGITICAPRREQPGPSGADLARRPPARCGRAAGWWPARPRRDASPGRARRAGQRGESRRAAESRAARRGDAGRARRGPSPPACRGWPGAAAAALRLARRSRCACSLLVLVLLLVLASPLVAVVAAAVAGRGAARPRLALRRRRRAARRRRRPIGEDDQTPEAVDALPRIADFGLSRRAARRRDPSSRRRPGPDSAEAPRFKDALRDTYGSSRSSERGRHRVRARRRSTSTPSPPTRPRRSDPLTTVPRGRLRRDHHPAADRRRRSASEFVEAMAYPVIDLPMYEPLIDLSGELLPAQHQPDRAEQRSRCWRPTSGSSRPTWSGSTTSSPASCCGASTPPTSAAATSASSGTCSGYLDRAERRPGGAAGEAARHPAAHRWSRARDSASTTTASSRATTEEELVLVIRGELLKKYPTAVIYAHRAAGSAAGDGGIDDRAEPRQARLDR